MQKLLLSIFTFTCVCFSSNLLAYPANLPSCLKDDYDQLEVLYKETVGDNWTNKTNWLVDGDMASWYGVVLTADGCDVAEINLSGNNLTRRMPVSISLGMLMRLDLSNNEIAGSISNMDTPNLGFFDLSNNRLDGEIVDFNLTNLYHLDLSKNLLRGPLFEFAAMRSLQYMDLSANQLVGDIPAFDMPRLSHLALNNNQLSGSLRDYMGMPELQLLDLSSNNFGGVLPFFTGFANLRFFDLHNNKFEGELPNLDMPHLETLNLSKNNLSGKIPDFDLPNLLVFDVHSNQFSGQIPRLNSSLVTTIDMSRNSLEGAIQRFDLPNLTVLNLSFNKMKGTIPDMNVPLLTDLLLSNNYFEGEILNVNYPKLVKLHLNNNGFKGIVPEFESTELTEVVVNDNYFSGNLPTFERNHLALLHIANNRFVFGDMVNRPWLGMSSPELQYNTQAELPLSFTGQYLTVETGAVDADQVFNWYRNGILVATTQSHQYQPAGTGNFSCQISHNNITVPSDAMRNLVLQTSTYSIAILAAELTTLSARPLSNEVQIAWQTTSEKNTDYFDIERSEDGKTFEKIGQQKAQGKATTLSNYTFLDKTAAFGTHYYRLKMVDMDKKFTFSNVVSATLESASKGHPLSISPNPATENVRFQFEMDAKATASLEVRDVLGRSVYHSTLSNSDVLEWQRGNAVNGIYFVVLTIGQKQFIEKLILK
jgi:Leucine-rich repeat (LRR) protein